ncbi:MAG: PP2C family serine/threonine-protein phosphatase [candidate division NC10 bacterium]
MFEVHGETDVGRRRQLNEDAIFAADGLFIVCDGMGGHKAGEVASRLATDVIANFIKRSQNDPELTWPCGFDPRLSEDANRLSTAIKLANRTVFHTSQSSDDYSGMGTTVVAVLVAPGRAEMTYGHVGDSRIYLIRDGAMTQLTKDDSLVNLVSADDAPAVKNVLTKALGVQEDVEFEVVGKELQAGDIVLLCSDGLTNMLPDPAILEVVTAQAGPLEEACRHLVAGANAQGGRDNISVLLVRYGG